MKSESDSDRRTRAHAIRVRSLVARRRGRREVDAVLRLDAACCCDCSRSRLSLGAKRPASARAVKDVATIEGIRDNQLVGYGLVVGTAGHRRQFPDRLSRADTDLRAWSAWASRFRRPARTAPATCRSRTWLPSSWWPRCRPSAGQDIASTSRHHRQAMRARSKAAFC